MSSYGFWTLVLAHTRPDGEADFNRSDFRRRLAPTLDVAPDDILLNCSVATHPQSAPTPQRQAQRDAVSRFAQDLAVNLTYVSDLYHSFCVAPAPPPSPPPDSPPVPPPVLPPVSPDLVVPVPPLQAMASAAIQMNRFMVSSRAPAGSRGAVSRGNYLAAKALVKPHQVQRPSRTGLP